MTDFRPWTTYATKEIEAELPIKEPPCKRCKFFAARRVYDNGNFIGVRLCHNDNMIHDFSCFRQRERRRPA